MLPLLDECGAIQLRLVDRKYALLCRSNPTLKHTDNIPKAHRFPVNRTNRMPSKCYTYLLHSTAEKKMHRSSRTYLNSVSVSIRRRISSIDCNREMELGKRNTRMVQNRPFKEPLQYNPIDFPAANVVRTWCVHARRAPRRKSLHLSSHRKLRPCRF